MEYHPAQTSITPAVPPAISPVEPSSQVKNLALLASAAGLAALSAYVNFLLFKNPLTLPGFGFIGLYATGVIFGLFFGFFSLLLNGSIIQRALRSILWLLISSVSYFAAFQTALMSFRAATGGVFMGSSDMQQIGMAYAMLSGGFVGALFFAVAFRWLFGVRIRIWERVILAVAGAFLGFLFGAYFDTTIGSVFLNAGWQIGMAALLFTFALPFALGIKKILFSLYIAIAVAIVGYMLTVSVLYPDAGPDAKVGQILETVVHSPGFPPGSSFGRVISPGAKDIYNRIHYPVSYLQNFTEPNSDTYQGIILYAYKFPDPDHISSQCSIGNKGTKRINDAFSFCLVYPAGSIGGVNQANVWFYGSLDPDKKIWAEVTTDMFLSPATAGVPSSIKYLTGYTDAQFVSDVQALEKESGSRF